MSLALPMPEFLDGGGCIRSRVHERERRGSCMRGSEEESHEEPGGCRGRSLLRLNVVRYTWTRGRRHVFANVGAVLKPPLMKLFRSSGAGDTGGYGEVKRGSGQRKASHGVGKIAARGCKNY